MSEAQPARRDLEGEIIELRERLASAESVLQAIRLGEIDAVVVNDPQGARVFTLEGADHPYRMLVETMNEGAATLSDDGTVLYCNPRLASLLEVPTAQIKGTRLVDWVAQPDRQRLAQLVQRTGQESERGELRLLTSSGTALPVHASFSSLELNGARFCCGIFTDLRLAKHQATLETAAQQVREANERLRQLDQRKDEFLATLAHELRNPLAPISAAAQVIKMLRLTDARLLQARDVIERQARHMARLVDDLMEVSRITLGKIELQRRNESLASVLNSVTDAARPIMDRAQHTFTVALPEEPLLIEADITRLAQALLNVLENAAKYTQPGGVVTLSAGREGNEAVIRVQDNGIGIAPEMIPRIFEMFVQADRSGPRARGGLGIGLALSRRLIEMHGGTITAASRGLGQGTEFTIRVPLGVLEVASSVLERYEAAPAGDPRRILVVDDNRDAAESLRMLLQLTGHEVEAVHGGVAALEAVEGFRPDVVLLDIGLPDLDGYHVARQLRERYGAQCPRLIALSGWGQVEDKRKAAEAGIDAHFTKPIDPRALAHLFTDHTDGGAGAASTT